MFKRIGKFFNTFTGALLMGVFSLLTMWSYAVENNGMAYVMAMVTAYWLWTAYRSNNRIKELEVGAMSLTPDQKARLKEATNNLTAVAREVELELVQTERKAKKKADEVANVQSDERKD